MKTLVIGGTGMLAGATQALLEAGNEVYSVSRNAPAFRHERLHVLLLDYHDLDTLRQALALRAPYDRALVWVHSTAPEVLFLAAEYVNGPLVHVLGSNPLKPERRRAYFAALGTDYREVQLGLIPAANAKGYRWLTHEEISGGALRAIQSGEKYVLVGHLEVDFQA